MKYNFESKIFALVLSVSMLLGSCMTVFAEAAEATEAVNTGFASKTSLLLAIITAFIITMLVSKKRTKKRENKRNNKAE
ncbi:MAG: hypothetical protein E7286_03675 [Lachnospiraceae bacterium]|nr:hypothetical protein [Lachnospiraceae bacterium]